MFVQLFGIYSFEVESNLQVSTYTLLVLHAVPVSESKTNLFGIDWIPKSQVYGI